MSMLESRTTQNTAAGQLAGTGGFAGILLAVRQAFPDLIPWPVELDAVLLAFVASTVGPWLSRQIAFWRNPEKKTPSDTPPAAFATGILFFLCSSLAMSGCASNGISVSERAVDGTTLTVKQQTFSTFLAKTQEGAGNFLYTAESPDGSKFDMRAGATVIGQDGGDPTALVTSILNMLTPVIGQKIQSDDNQARIEAEVSAQEMQAAIALIEEMNRRNAGR